MTATASAAGHWIAAAPAADPLPFPDELLEEIFLRLGGAADLARACAACASFRRVITTAPPFLRHFFRSHHTRPTAGARVPQPLRLPPASPPHRSAPAAAALARAADFDFSFFPERGSWSVAGARHDANMLVCRVPARWHTAKPLAHGKHGISRSARRITGFDGAFTDADDFADLVVCDPLFRRYVLVPPIPDDLAAILAASIPRRGGRSIAIILGDLRCRGRGQGESKVVAFVFRSGGGNGEWRLVANLISRSTPLPQMLFNAVHERSYAHGCFYWIVDPNGCYSVVLDTRDMKFTTIDLPRLPTNNNDTSVIVEAGEGMLGLLTFDHSARAICLFRRARRDNNGVGGVDEEWQLSKTAPFPYRGSFMALGAAGVYLLVLGREYLSPQCCHYYTLDLKTLLLERLYVLLRLDRVILSSHIYARFSPLLTPPCI
ncbi:unnamed protein product [Urochloa decumbens]|uniref:F-box domain-containing protein n=1 Tax=Urochloa decumbens TaxID=240449 RepID=A0ABC8VHJ3_9POAL